MTSTDPNERLAYSVDEAAAITGLSRDLLYDQMRRGNLTCVKIGRRRLITRQHWNSSWASHPDGRSGNSRLPCDSAPSTAGDVPDGDRVFGDLVQDPVPAYPQPPQVGRPIRERPSRAGIVSQPVNRVQNRADALRTRETRPPGVTALAI